jgi:hypothetical protein
VSEQHSDKRVTPCPVCGCGSAGMPCAPSSNGEMNGLRLSNGGINQPVRAGEQTPVAWLIEHGEKEIVYGKRRYITFRDANDPTFWLHDKRPSTTKVTPLYTRSATWDTKPHTIKLTERQSSFLRAIMQNIADTTDDESVQRDALAIRDKAIKAWGAAMAASDGGSHNE